ncbi:MAG TPA: thioredoxin [Candidatus Edwardsbacteria bacterium]|nr:thioredoxin [Candidatus Edwardsbacteria bacterium]
MPLVHLTDATFDQEVLKSDLPVIVDFWAGWCGPCRMVGPIFEELSGEYAGKLKFGKVDVDANPAKSAQYGIRSIPALLVFKGGRVVDTIIGAMPKAALAQKIDAALAK